MASIKIVTEAEAKYTMAGAGSKLLLLTARPPETDETAAAVQALETAVSDYVAAVGKVKAVDEAEAEASRKVRREAVDAVEEGRAPRKLKPVDFDAQREAAQAHADALLAKAKRARTALDRQVELDREDQGRTNADRVPELYEEAVATIKAAREAVEHLLAGRESAIEQLRGDPNFKVRQLPWHGPLLEHLDSAEHWLRDNEQAAVDLLIDLRGVEPPLHIRRQMAQAGDLLPLYNVEKAEGFAISNFTLGWDPPLIAGPQQRASVGVSESDGGSHETSLESAARFFE